jgi:hypothetical protein
MNKKHLKKTANSFVCTRAMPAQMPFNRVRLYVESSNEDKSTVIFPVIIRQVSSRREEDTRQPASSYP